MLPALARRLGLGGDEAPAESLRLVLGDGTAIVVVDDAEDVADELDELLAMAPGLQLVATASTSSGRDLEHVHEVAPLPPTRRSSSFVNGLVRPPPTLP